MLTLHNRRCCTTDWSPEEVVRAHIEQRSLEQLQEPVTVVLQLIASHQMLDEVEASTCYQRSAYPAKRPIIQ